MRDYAKIAPQFWIGTTGKRIKKLGAQAQVVSLYLVSSPHSNMIGLYHLPLAYLSADTGMPFEGALKALTSLENEGFCGYDADAEVVWVYEMARFQVGEALKPGDNQCKGVQNAYDSVPANRFTAEFFRKYGAQFNMTKERIPETPLEAPWKPLGSQEQEQEQEQEQDQEQTIVEQQAARPSANEAVSRVFSYWQSIMGTNRAVLDQKRKKVIQGMLKAGYSADDLCKAIRGCSKSAFHMGQNENGAKYNGLDLICRNAEYVDRFMAYDDSPPVPKGKQATIESINRAAGDAFLNDDRDIFGPGPIIEGECSHA